MKTENKGMPFARLDMLDIDKSVSAGIEPLLLKKHKILPVCINDDGVLLLAVADPLDLAAMSVMALYHSGPICRITVPEAEIIAFIDSVAADRGAQNALSHMQRVRLPGNAARTDTEGAEGRLINAPAVELVDSVIKEAIPARASDIHIEPFESTVTVRYRIDGDLTEWRELPGRIYPETAARIKIIAGMDIAERRIPQDGRFRMNINGAEYDFRVSSLPTVYGEKFVIRILDNSAFAFERADIGFSEANNRLVDKILAKPYGMILLTGPTGCGKSTTLYSFLKELRRPQVNIVTVEDPVEYNMNKVNQTQVNVRADMTFANVLRSILRQDPDIIMIGEIRDEETARIATRAAITGHLVLSTLHTNDAPGAFMRLVDMGVGRYLVADVLVAVISQRLVKRLCPYCGKEELTTPAETAFLGMSEPVIVKRAVGCRFCGGTGYRGRVAVHEIMYVDDNMRMAMSGVTGSRDIRKTAIENGMIPIHSTCREYVLRGVTDLRELYSLGGEGRTGANDD